MFGHWPGIHCYRILTLFQQREVRRQDLLRRYTAKNWGQVATVHWPGYQLIFWAVCHFPEVDLWNSFELLLATFPNHQHVLTFDGLKNLYTGFLCTAVLLLRKWLNSAHDIISLEVTFLLLGSSITILSLLLQFTKNLALSQRKDIIVS